MKEINNVQFFDIEDIYERFHNRITLEEITNYFEEGKIKGEKIENKWHADQAAIDDFIQNVIIKERSLEIGPQKINLSNVKLNGRILDIGGGGEGVIGQFKGGQVIAIDPNKNELEEAPRSGALKIIMNAKELKFLDNTFDTVTAFFTFMYIPPIDHEKIFKEIHRVLTSNGNFVLWDAIMPIRENYKRDIFLIRLEIIIGNKTIDAGYGVLWDKEQNIEYYSNLAEKVGFEVIESKVEKDAFYLRFKKS